MGQYEYLRMPLGLCNGPLNFRKFINKVFRDLIDGGKVLIYFDDILIATNIASDLETIKQVLLVLINNKLKLLLDKYHFPRKK